MKFVCSIICLVLTQERPLIAWDQYYLNLFHFFEPRIYVYARPYFIVQAGIYMVQIDLEAKFDVFKIGCIRSTVRESPRRWSSAGGPAWTGSRGSQWWCCSHANLRFRCCHSNARRVEGRPWSALGCRQDRALLCGPVDSILSSTTSWPSRSRSCYSSAALSSGCDSQSSLKRPSKAWFNWDHPKIAYCL